MELNPCTETLGPDDWTEDHPKYNEVCGAFDDAFTPAVARLLPEDFHCNNEGFASDYLIAIDEILYELYGVGEFAGYTYKNDAPPTHSYRGAIAQAKTIALSSRLMN